MTFDVITRDNMTVDITPPHLLVLQIGKAKVVLKSDSDAVLVIAAGITLDQALKAADKLKADHGVNIRILDPFTIKPIDKVSMLQTFFFTKDVATKTATVIRRSTVLSLPLQLVFPGQTLALVFVEGILIEGEGSVQLTSSLR